LANGGREFSASGGAGPVFGNSSEGGERYQDRSGELANAQGARERGLSSGKEPEESGLGSYCVDVALAGTARQRRGHIPNAQVEQPVIQLLPEFPPGPTDFNAWREVLAFDPSLEPALCRLAYGRPYRVDELRLAGNGVCPLTAAKAFVTLHRELNP